jgi:hypothetical protein
VRRDAPRGDDDDDDDDSRRGDNVVDVSSGESEIEIEIGDPSIDSSDRDAEASYKSHESYGSEELMTPWRKRCPTIDPIVSVGTRLILDMAPSTEQPDSADRIPVVEHETLQHARVGICLFVCGGQDQTRIGTCKHDQVKQEKIELDTS